MISSEPMVISLDRLPDTNVARDLLGRLLACPSAPGPRRMDASFALYGAGKLGLMALDFFRHVGLAPTLVVDANAANLATESPWNRLSMMAPAEVPDAIQRDLPLVVSIATSRFADLAQTLKSQGWRDVIPFYDVTEAYRDRYPLGNGWFMAHLDAPGRESIERVLANWYDDQSRAHHLQFMAWHRLRQDWCFESAPVDQDHRYFIPEVTSVLNGRETFVDAGAHRGEIARAFRQRLMDQFESILMLEPDLANASVIEAELLEFPLNLKNRHRLLKLALSDQAGSLPFFPGLGYASQLTDMGKETAEAVTLDDLAVAPSFVKLHLEGHELQALRGGLATLRRHRPILAMTAYHNEAGLWPLPAWLIDNLSSYRHYFRLHSWCGTGAVIYCVPEERHEASPGDSPSGATPWGRSRQ